MTADENGEAPPPHAQLIQMATGLWVSRIVYAAARLGLADHLAAGPRSAAELAAAVGAHERSLHRLMRTLAGLGLLNERDGQRFALTPLGSALRADAPGSARATVLNFGSPWAMRMFGEFMHAVETGGIAFDRAMGMPLFDYLAQHPEDASQFSETMVGFHGAEPAAIAAAYDFSGFGTVVDVGGATGNLLAAILARHAGPRGILFDRPHVVRDAPALLAAHGVGDRVTIESGSFFESVPPGGDAYLLSHIIHDWNEDQCLTILGHCRDAMKPGGRLLTIEMVLPAGDAPHPGKVLDMVMLAATGGEERTGAEYASLLAKAGFRMTRVVPTESAASVVEAVLA
ncbi:MAG: methyltransferase [Burkholderiaceae bacterium]|nr:methyltransferase [Burkholderiaceae bacterium]